MRSSFSLLFLSLFLALPAPALEVQEKAEKPSPTLGVPLSTPLGKALASFDAERYRKELLWWASDERDGRETGTRGAREARAWALARFEEFGLIPMGVEVGGKRTYDQPFPIHIQMRDQVDPAEARLTLAGKDLLFLRDWTLLGGRRKAEIGEASLVFGGYGLTDEDLVRCGAKGKVLVLREGRPGKPLDMVRDPRPGWLPTFLAKAKRAARFGALALLMVSPPGSKRPLFSEHQDLVPWRGSFCPVIQLSWKASQALMKDLQAGEGGKAGTFPGVKVTLKYAADKERVGRNLIGLWKGSDPKLSKEYLVIGAHRDHIGIGAYGSRARKQRGEIHNGADDNATGSVGVIEIARALATARFHPKRSILFILFDAEEMGLIGSRYWVRHPTVPLERVVAMINMDMIGRVRDKKCQVMGTNTSPAWEAALKKATARSPLEWRILPSGFGGSDHLPFMMSQIPAVFFHSGLHPDYHTPQDDPEKCNPRGAVEALKVLLYTAQQIADAPARPKFQAPKRSGRRPRRRFTLGVALRQTGKGPEVRAVVKGSLAEKLGIQEGDLLLSINGRRVRSISDVYRRLRRASRSKKITVTWSRGTRKFTKSSPVKAKK